MLPFKDDLSIDWDGYARLLDYCACPDGIAAVFVNGHAGEGGSLSDEERQAVIARTRAHIGAKPLLAGIIAHSTAEAIRQARLAEAAGADCAVLFPSAAIGGGASATPRAPVAFVRAVSEAIAVPVSIFQYPVASGFGYSSQTLAEMAAIDRVIAVKEGSDTMLAYDENRRAVKKADPEVAVPAVELQLVFAAARCRWRRHFVRARQFGPASVCRTLAGVDRRRPQGDARRERAALSDRQGDLRSGSDR